MQFLKSKPAEEFLLGIKLTLPLILSTLPFGFTYGALALDQKLTWLQAQSFSVVLYAGSSQMVALKMASVGSTAFAIILQVFLLNIRHLLYSASVAWRVVALHWPQKIFLAYFLTDEAYVATLQHWPKKNSDFPWVFLGAGLFLWFDWQVSTFLGIAFRSYYQGGISFDFLFVIFLVATTAKGLKQIPNLLAVLGAAFAFFFFHGFTPSGAQFFVFSSFSLFTGYCGLKFFPFQPPTQIVPKKTS